MTRSSSSRVSSRAQRQPVDTRLRARAGFTIAELMVSVVIITVGVLALMSTSVGVLRQMRAGNQAAIAAAVGQSRMETIRSQQCGADATGSATTRGVTEAWSIAAVPTTTRIKAVAETVTYVPSVGVTRKLGFAGLIPCV